MKMVDPIHALMVVLTVAPVSVKTPSPDWNVFNLVSTANGEVRLSPREVFSWRTETIHPTTSKEPTMDAITTLVEGAMERFDCWLE